MKKYIASIILGLIVGVFLSKTLLEEYNGYTGIKQVSKNGLTAYFIKYGDYKDISELEKKTISLTNYIYLEKNGIYSVYIGITFREDIRDKLVNYFNNLNYNVSYEEFNISNDEYINYLYTADKLLDNTSDESVFGEVCSQVLSKYEELVINGSKN